MRRTVFLLLVLLQFSSIDGATCDRKPLMGPPEHFDRYRAASPFDSTADSRSVMLKQIDLLPNDKYESDFHVDSGSYFTLALLSSSEDALNQFKIVIEDPEGAPVTPSLTTNEEIALDGFGVPTITFAVTEPQPGTWNVRVTRVTDENNAADLLTAYILVGVPDSVYMQTGLTSYDLLVGDVATFKTLPVDAEGLQNRKTGALSDVSPNAKFDNAHVTIYEPDGDVIQMSLEKEMRLDSATNQSVPSGVYEGTYKAEIAGLYKAVVSAQGEVQDGEKEFDFGRTSWLLFNVVEKSVELTGKANIDDVSLESDCLDRLHLGINVGVRTTNGESYRAYGEVWGKSLLTGKDVPIGWISGITQPKPFPLLTEAMRLRIDLSYLVKALARPPYTLRNFRVEETATFITVSKADSIGIDVTSTQSTSLVNILKGREKFRTGCGKSSVSNATKATGDGPIVLAHGYCAKENSFPLEQFTNPVVFEDFGKSRSTEDYAILLCDFTKEYESFSIVGHSHGGLASVHLYTYFETGIDRATGGRLVQSVGSPYGGCPLAGLLAVIGDILGIGCGENADLTYDGATRWAKLLPEENQQNVYFYTTQYDTGGLINYCLLPAQAVLGWPNDGIVETSRTELPYGNYVNHKKGECHMNGMKWPPQARDPERAQEMNAAAAR